MLEYLGAFIAFGLLSKQPISLNLAPVVWKQILGEQMQLSDLNEIDSNTANLIINLEQQSKVLSDEEFEQYLDQKFDTVLSNCDMVDLKPNGGNILVKSSTV